MQQSIQELAEKHVKSCYPSYESPELLVDLFITGYATGYVAVTPPSEAEGQGEWINASKEIPDESNKRIKWRDANSHAEISTTAARSAIHTDQAEFVEWYKSHPAPSGPLEADFETALEAEIDKLPNKPHSHENEYNSGQISGFELGAKWARQYLAPKPVDTDFVTALTNHGINAGIEHGRDFEEGARFAWEYLLAIPEATGPWHLKSHGNTEDDDTVWATDGKMSFYIDEFNFDDFPDADYWLVNFLNKYGFKLSIDESHQIVISHLEEQIEYLKSQQAGAKWQPIDELTKDHNLCKTLIKFDNGDIRRYLEKDLPKAVAIEFMCIDSPAPEQVDPVKFHNWVRDNTVSDGAPKVVFRPTGDRMTTAELLSKYTASLKNKQG